MNRYRQLAHACLTLLVVAYLAAIYSADLQRFNQSAFCACVRRITKPSPARNAAVRRATRIVRIRACPRWIAKHCATSQGLWDRPVSLLRQCRGVVCCDVRSSSNEVRRVYP